MGLFLCLCIEGVHSESCPLLLQSRQSPHHPSYSTNPAEPPAGVVVLPCHEPDLRDGVYHGGAWAVVPREGSCPALRDTDIASRVSPGTKAPEASSAVVTELPGLGSCPSCTDRSRCPGKSPQQHPRSRGQHSTVSPQCMAWLPANGLEAAPPPLCSHHLAAFSRVAFGSFSFYLNICFPAEVLESTALATGNRAVCCKH